MDWVHGRIEVKGRPKGTNKKRTFFETKLGCFLYYAAPIEYKMIMLSCSQSYGFTFPSVHAVETIMKASNSHVKKKKLYERAMADFLKYGQFPPRVWKDTPERIKYYTSMVRSHERYIGTRSQTKIKNNRDISGK